MRGILYLIILFSASIGSSFQAERKLACYFLVGNGPVSVIDPKLCSHVLAYGMLSIDKNNLRVIFHTQTNNKIVEQLRALKSQNPNLKVVGVLGCGGDGCRLGEIVVNPQLRANFVKSAIDVLKNYQFDGLDLDWEYPACPNHKCDDAHRPEKNGFSELLKELKRGMSSNQTLSAAVHPIEWISKEAYDFGTLSSTLDFINVMDYDAAGGWDGKTGHHSNFIWVQNSMNYWASKVPKNKLLMGIPFYGVKFTLKDPKQHGFNAPIVGESTQITYSQICKSIKNEGWHKENTERGPIAYKDNQWVSFDDTASATKKANWIRDNGFGGAMVWETNQDDIKGECSSINRPMMRALASGLK